MVNNRDSVDSVERTKSTVELLGMEPVVSATTVVAFADGPTDDSVVTVVDDSRMVAVESDPPTVTVVLGSVLLTVVVLGCTDGVTCVPVTILVACEGAGVVDRALLVRTALVVTGGHTPHLIGQISRIAAFEQNVPKSI